jgi:hypothetical protein
LRERFAIIAPGHWLSLAVLFPIERPRFIAVSPLQSIRRCVVVESGILRPHNFGLSPPLNSQANTDVLSQAAYRECHLVNMSVDCK